MAEAVKPRRKHRKKDGKKSKYKMEDAADENLLDNEEKEEPSQELLSAVPSAKDDSGASAKGSVETIEASSVGKSETNELEEKSLPEDGKSPQDDGEVVEIVAELQELVMTKGDATEDVSLENNTSMEVIEDEDDLTTSTVQDMTTGDEPVTEIEETKETEISFQNDSLQEHRTDTEVIQDEDDVTTSTVQDMTTGDEPVTEIEETKEMEISSQKDSLQEHRTITEVIVDEDDVTTSTVQDMTTQDEPVTEIEETKEMEISSQKDSQKEHHVSASQSEPKEYISRDNTVVGRDKSQQETDMTVKSDSEGKEDEFEVLEEEESELASAPPIPNEQTGQATVPNETTLQSGQTTENPEITGASLSEAIGQLEVGMAPSIDLTTAENVSTILSTLTEITTSNPLQDKETQESELDRNNEAAVTERADATRAHEGSAHEGSAVKVDMLESEGSLSSQPLDRVSSSEMVALTEEQLAVYYHNPRLQEQAQFVQEFVQACSIERHEFYELVTNYFKAQKNMVGIRNDLTSLHNEYTSLKERLYTTKENYLLAKGMCADSVAVKENFHCQTVQFNPDVHRDLDRLAKCTRSIYHDTYALCLYTAQLSKLQIDSYLHQMYVNNSVLFGVSTEATVAASTSPGSREREAQIGRLRECISVLFAFQRRPVNDLEFLHTSRGWLDRLIATLLRLATLDDHLFLLNHILRCPAGVDQWATRFLQIVPPVHPSNEGAAAAAWWPQSLGNPHLDHFVNMLAFFMRPIRHRAEFLVKMKKPLPTSPEGLSTSPFNWTLLDEDGEEDEVNDSALLNENDLVAILAQFPFDRLFKYVLQITDAMAAENSYSIQHVSSDHMMWVIAFSSRLIQVLHEGVLTFNMSRYRQFVKRLGRLIRHIVQHVSDHWLNYRSFHGDSSTSDVGAQQHSISILQLEFDEFFFRATKCIMSAPRLGTWQFMTDMPYTSLSAAMMWRLLWFLHQSDAKTSLNLGVSLTTAYYVWNLTDPSHRDHFEEKLADMSMSEVIYLLTTFANMSSARPATEKTFIDFVVLETYELSYLRTQSREFCSKIGRELLSAIATTHPFAISTILHQAQRSVATVGGVLLYLFHGLPLHLWHPEDDDITMLKDWLLGYDLAKPENQLVRLVLSKMNWGLTEQEDALFLGISLHRTVAVLIVEAYIKVVSAKFSGSSRLGTGPFANQEHSFDMWAWGLITKLRLHRHNQPRPVLLTSTDGLTSTDELTTGSEFGDVPDAEIDTWLYPLQKALQMNTAIGCYAAVAMTKNGHSVDNFITKGIPNMQTLIQNSCQKYCLPLLAVVVSMFLEEGHPDYLLTNEKFLNIVHNILLTDHQTARMSGSNNVPGSTTTLFTGMVLTHIHSSLATSSNTRTAESIMSFWLRLVTTRSGWHVDPEVCYILDEIIAAAFCHQGGCDLAVDIILKQYKELKSETKHQGFFSTVMSLVTMGSPMPSLLDKQAMEKPWLAYCILTAETRYLTDIGLLKEISAELFSEGSVTPDTALKKASSKLKLDYTMNVARLPVYRWAQLALDTDLEHPLLPVIWQQFFTIYLERGQSSHAGGSVGQRYFQSITNLTYLKRLKRRLSQAADFHHDSGRRKPDVAKSTSSPNSASSSVDRGEAGGSGAGLDEGMEGGDCDKGPVHHVMMVQLYQMYMLWLEEPLLHDASLYLPSLPQQYEAEKLSRIFNRDQNLWMEYVNVNQVNHRTEFLIKCWVSMSRYDISSTGFSASITSEQQQIDSATSRILNRVSSRDPPQPAPSLVPIIPPVPDIPNELLLNNHAMLVFLQDDIKQLLHYAESFSDRENHNVVLDCEYLEMIPDLHSNKQAQSKLQIPCKSAYNPMHQCKGAAIVTVMHKAKHTDERVSRKLDENRAFLKQLLSEASNPPPTAVVVAAVHIENAITDLLTFSRTLTDRQAELEAAKQTGVSLLYHLGQQMTESARHYPPTRQFFSSCIEILGQEFIRPYPEQAQPLLQAMLSNSNLTGLLAPNLVPSHCGDSFVQMYSEVVRVGISGEHDTAFMLLTKFDPIRWLASHQAILPLRTQFIEVIFEALISCGAEMDNKTQMMFEHYQTHLQVMLMYQFPEHYGGVMRLLLTGSSENRLHQNIWLHIMKSLHCPVLSISSDTITNEQVTDLIQTQPILSLQQLKETVQWLTTYFNHQRSAVPQSAQFGLYSTWKLYHQPLVSFIGYVIFNTIILEAHRVVEAQLDIEPAVRYLWTLLTGLFYPWITAGQVASPTNANSKQWLPPWVEGDTVQASCMVSMFSHAVGCLEAQFEGLISPLSNSLALLWPFYHDTLAKVGLREDILNVYHQHLIRLPWNHFHPDLTSMELMVQVFEDKGLHCLAFLGYIFPRIPWQRVADIYCRQGDDPTANKFLSSLLSLVVIFMNDKKCMQAQGLAMQQLVSEVTAFPWQLLDASSYDSAATWQSHSCEPKCVLNLSDRGRQSSLSLMHAIIQFNPSSFTNNSDEAGKRSAYIRLVVDLLCKCSLLPDLRKDWFPAAVHQLLNDIELLATAGGPNSAIRQELTSLLSTLLSLLNNCSPIRDAPIAVLDAISTWFDSSKNSALCLPCVTAACRSLASVKHLAVVVEGCIEAHFNTNMDLSPDPSRGWTIVVEVLQVPELTHEAFLTECSKQGSMLTLYAYVRQRSPQCLTLEEEYTLYTKVIDWCIKCRPRPANEAKVFLWWHKVFQMTIHQAEFGSPLWTLSRCLNNLIPSMVLLGEDRSSSGLLGAIGFGRQSDLSYRFRLIARIMAAFLAAQTLSNGTIRLVSNAPGLITKHHDGGQHSSQASTPDSPKPSLAAYQTLKHLGSAIDNKNYVGYAEHGRFAQTFLLNPNKCFKDAGSLLCQLVNLMYSEKHYLSVMREV